MFNIKEFRKLNNLTQTQIAEYFSCDQAFISQIESGKRPMPDAYISKLMRDKKYLLPDPVDIEPKIIKNNNVMYQELIKAKTQIRKLEEELERYRAIVDNLTGRTDDKNKQTGS